MKIAVVVITDQGEKVGRKIHQALGESKLFVPARLGKDKESDILFEGRLRDLVKELFAEFEGIVFCMALGIVVRVIAPYLKDKYQDPAIVVVDEAARFAISTLSGHEGGANKLAYAVANSIGAQAIVTTASETNKKIIVGLGCRKKAKKEDIKRAITEGLKMRGLSLGEVMRIATVEIKKNETGLEEACAELGVPLTFVPCYKIANFGGKYQKSDLVRKKIGLDGVSEPCALLAGRRAKLILPKTVICGVTIAIAREDCT
ncbi:cobalt-precorrin 5A hydrolase [Candidatus Hakubella thermalkaliphila]|uniref:Cobalt-precorrin 5A hydrolase n=1 Tax=Candidatus Hakubella thermalkaliphila TaxID=2754717 RepID=A0A6V8PUG1_9ACTN|nr:cobalamin biosynthesis protein [Candidatus Hakubella thermalkaliphila]GFP34656.1 cobalt-precorrin 5A hydrolase [Candidatus Hakubella thermalkaliphila]